MPKFFYSSPNFQQHHTPDSWWRRLKKSRKRKAALKEIDANLVKIKNPFLSRKENVVEKRSNSLRGLIFFLVLLVGWLVTMAYIPYFQVKNLSINGCKLVKSDDLRQYVESNYLIRKYSWWPVNNFFFVDEKRMSEVLVKNFPLESVSVIKKFPNAVEIVIKEKISSIIYDNGEKYFVLDQKGNLVKTMKLIGDGEYSQPDTMTSSTSSTIVRVHTPNFVEIKNEIGNYPLLFDRRQKGNEIKLEPEIASVVLIWNDILAKQGITVKYYVLEGAVSGLIIKTDKPYDIMVNIHGDPISEFENMRAILSQYKPMEHIDLRYGERVYWK